MKALKGFFWELWFCKLKFGGIPEDSRTLMSRHSVIAECSGSRCGREEGFEISRDGDIVRNPHNSGNAPLSVNLLDLNLSCRPSRQSSIRRVRRSTYTRMNERKKRKKIIFRFKFWSLELHTILFVS
ncbi:hypothetical protein NE237_003363 [Protea cynaroides]|uniref:Uncharacterized protein n=1 Tax=Protea cynaroides TaxID=273540 RepID=A0A9Q0KGW5_9MAGN|nr:hypothetical protein NE237_003363 [Protea cynaroides]